MDSGPLRHRRKRQAVAYLGGKCEACGGVFRLSQYDFHHVDPNTKEFSIGDGLGYKWLTLAAELEKCILLCANCHRLVHDPEFVLSFNSSERG